MKSIRLAIFASGNGTNAERIISYFKAHSSIEVAMLLSNKPDAPALARAANAGLPTRVFSREQFRETGEVLRWLRHEKITHIVLAGFLWHVPDNLVTGYPDRIINIHPALLPKHGGKGMYGSFVHEAVRAANDKETGITIHLVNHKYDEGQILLQVRCSVQPFHTAEQIAAHVHQLEHEYYPKAVESWVLNQKIENLKS
jgi:phosphoribosylglycinamide formyltransferase-1